MAAKPGDFLIGVVDFFAILLPGAVAAFVGMGAAQNYVSAHEDVFGAFKLDNLWADARGWVLFAVASYLLGQFIYMLGSSIDVLYDLVRRFFKADWLNNDRIKGWAVVKWLRSGWVQNERLYTRVRKIKEEDVGDREEAAVSPLQWAKANVQIHRPEAAAEISRLEADQKFFRGLMVVLLLVCVLFRLKAREFKWADLLPYVALLILSFLKYAGQRLKGQNLAYTYLVALQQARASVGPELPRRVPRKQTIRTRRPDRR